MIDDDYTRRFLELLRYVPYLKEEKANIQRFTSGLPMALKDRIEFDDPRSLDETIRKLKHCEQSKRKSETKPYWKGNAKNKGKWDKKRVRPQGIGNKENATPSKKFNAFDRGWEFRS